MSDTLDLATFPAFTIDDYDGETIETVARHDEYATYGAVNVVQVSIKGVTVNLLPEQAVEYAAAVIASANIAKGDYRSAKADAEVGMLASIFSKLAVEQYKAGDYPQQNAA